MGIVWATATVAQTDLTSTPRYLPYQAQPPAARVLSQTGVMYRGNAVAIYDVDGDGRQDLICASANYVAARGPYSRGSVTYYQTNLPPACIGREPTPGAPAIRLVADLDGDQRQDLVVVGPARDETAWWYMVMDPRSGRVWQQGTLPNGPDARADGHWDGLYYVVGTIPAVRDGVDVPALILGCTVGFDKYGRGILAIDPRDGTVLWRYRTGPNPMVSSTTLSDLDGDGRAEVVFVGRSPSNLGGETINGFSDDDTRLFVLDRRGTLRWSQRLGGSFGNGEVQIADLTGDGRPEIATCARTTPDVWGEIVVWDRTGRAVARLAEPRQFQFLKLLPRPDHTPPSLLVTTSRGELRAYDLLDGGLVLRRSARFPANCVINYVGDFLPPPGPEIVVSSLGGATIVLDGEFKALVDAGTPGGAWAGPARVWQPDPRTAVLFWPCVHAPSMVISRAPFAWQKYQHLGAAGLVLGLGAVGIWWRRRPGRIDPRLLREVRLGLLENLELSDHGAIAPLKCVRRLVWQLRALQTDLGDATKVEIRMREAWTECQEAALPHLRGLIDRARLAGANAKDIGIVAANLASLERQLNALARASFQIAGRDELTDRLDEAARQADAALVRIRTELAEDFRADVRQVVDRVRTARATDLRRADIRLRIGAVAAAAGGGEIEPGPAGEAIGLCDPHELEFILDNLVGNAIAAMKSAPTRNLDLTWRRADGMILIDVVDTGRGLAAELQGRALNSRYSSKPHGGDGLPKSRRCLRKYGGNLSIVRSAPGQGTTFRVTLPVQPVPAVGGNRG